MVFSSAWVAAVATLSADLCQYVACNPERLPGDEVLRLLCCLPLHYVGRLTLRLFSFFCFPVSFPSPPAARFRNRYPWPSLPSSSSSYSSSDDDSDVSDDDDGGSAGYDSHSD